MLPVLIQLVVIIVVARVFAVLFRKLGQPSVVGEIAAGLMLGPSVLGYFLPGLSNVVFHPLPHGGKGPISTDHDGLVDGAMFVSRRVGELDGPGFEIDVRAPLF
ncbi:MAG: cation:proton antiporter, partial [Thermodesulfobacteriota bacterium]